MQADGADWQLQGVRLKFYDSVADILLLEIPGTISDAAEPYRLGYDGSADAVPRRALAIHHPHGNVKRVSYANARQGMPGVQHAAHCRRADFRYMTSSLNI